MFMFKQWRTVFVMASVMLLPLASQAASFNCKKASKPTERAICHNSQLSQADEAMNETYQILMGYDGDKRYIRNEQLRWLRERNQCGSRVACIGKKYEKRMYPKWRSGKWEISHFSFILLFKKFRG